MNRIDRDWTELDFSKVNFEPGSGWSWGRGGRPLDDWEYSISFSDDDGQQDRYKLPGCISQMLRMQERFGANAAKRAIKSALAEE